MFKALFFVLLGLYSLFFTLLYFRKRSKNKTQNKDLSLIGFILNAVCTLILGTVYLLPSMAANVQDMLLNLMLGTYMPTIMFPVLLLLPVVLSSILSAITRKAAALKTTAIWLGLFVGGMAVSWLAAALLAPLL